MAKVSLRIYNREIERLVEQGQTDEAIAHCRHILKTFPKHLETYRLLGKAYLEARRYGEAVDIFGRLLMAVPDDFVAHVGLSIIRDEENKLDDAIWHMERAFEVQSSNAAIQSELQRLYGRRDGMEPPKVRMTRGALARIYGVGELYPQAIAEIRGVLAEDPQRIDMQMLLAHSYFKSGQRSDATDICNQLLKRYAYTFDANRIMVELLPATTGSVESTQVYRMHIAEMDPYSNFTKGSIFQTADVPDASINLERLEYSGEEVPMEQDWNNTSLGFSAVAPLSGGTSLGDEQPDWLRPADGTPQDSAGSFSQSQAGEELPDFLKSAGWGEASGPETPSSIFDEEPGDAGIIQGDIPDWLKAQAPADDQRSNIAEPIIETPDYLSGLDNSFDPFAGAAAPSGDTPDWLKGTGDVGASAVSFESSPAQPLGASTEMPDWMQGLSDTPQNESPSAGDSPDWLAGLGGAAVASASAFDEPVAEPGNLPDWLQSSDAKQEAVPASVESLGASAQEQDDAVAWLESLAAKHGAKPEELVTDPNKRNETPPDWVAQAQIIGAQAPAESEPVIPQWSESAANVGEEFFAEFEKASTAEPAVDETGMWLRNLEDKNQTPEASQGDLPDWMSAEEERPLERGSIPEWLSDSAPAADTKPEDSLNTASLPDWLGGLDQPAASQSTFEPEEALVKNQDLTDWLSGLDDEPGLNIDPETLRAPQPPLESNRSPQVDQGASDLPSWMEAEESAEEDSWTPPTPPEAAPVALSADLPEWLQSVDDEKEDLGGEDTPPWVHREQWETEGSDGGTLPKPTSPSDWHPIATAGSAQKETAKQSRGGGQKLVQSPPAPEPSARTEKKKSPAKQGLPRQRKPDDQSLLGLAKAELDRGDIPEALMHFGKLIKKGKHLEEVIGNLTESLYRYPVEVSIWQALGDAYMRENRLKEALEAYNKAEELIR